VHIHAKVHLSNTDVLTTQLYFDDRVTDAVYARPPYTGRPDRDTTNGDDGFYSRSTMLAVTPDGDGHLALIILGIAA
jgi:protocatechuate 3,4-dioxygenase beta subunit